MRAEKGEFGAENREVRGQTHDPQLVTRSRKVRLQDPVAANSSSLRDEYHSCCTNSQEDL